MPKLHELLPVCNSLEGQRSKVLADMIATFAKREHLFTEKVIQVQPLQEGQPATEERQSTLQTTVMDELIKLAPIVAKALDVSLAIDIANTTAKADIVLEDASIPLAVDIPATALLELEKSLTQILSLVQAIPTLDPAKGFTETSDRKYVYKARDLNKIRTKKAKEVFVLYAATKEHPAQTQMIDKDVDVAKLVEQEFSGLLTPQQKSDMCVRCEELIRAVRAARARANNVDVPKSAKIGMTLLNHIINGSK